MTEAGRFFDREAELYDAAHDRGNPGANPLQARMAVVMRLLGPTPGRVLDCGMGPGRLLVELDRLGWSVAGVDASGEMVARARARLPQSADDLVEAPVEALPFPSETFDAAVSTGVLEYVEDVSRALGEVARVLRPGGLFVVSMPNPRALRTLWRHDVVYPVVRVLKRVARVGRPTPLRRPGTLTLRDAKERLEAAGLRVEHVEHMASPVPAPLRKLLPSTATELRSPGPQLTSLLGAQFVISARKAD
jgi:ubiquinone/menaquinone biosynthesis C-methylase UbiE